VKTYRIGQIVPSSNVTMETEIPFMLNQRQQVLPERFTFHSSRMRMKTVQREELAAMDRESDRCVLELSDAQVDVLGYACLVAIMAMGLGYHKECQQRLHQRTVENGHGAPVVSSAGALLDALSTLGARRIALVAPYMKPLTQTVIDYIQAEGFTVVDSIALEIPNNLDVARHDSARLPAIAQSLDLREADAIVVSACVQMPSLAIVPRLEALTRKPVISAAIATTYAMLKSLELQAIVPGAGALLSGAY
jgi:maleate isomerase